MRTSILTAGFGLLFSLTAQAEIKGYACVGTEPFFSIDIPAAKGTLKFNSPESEKTQKFEVKAPVNAAGVGEGNVVVVKGAKYDVTATLMSSTLAGAKCSDGMSDNEYAFHLVFTRGSDVYYGCCDQK